MTDNDLLTVAKLRETLTGHIILDDVTIRYVHIRHYEKDSFKIHYNVPVHDASHGVEYNPLISNGESGFLYLRTHYRKDGTIGVDNGLSGLDYWTQPAPKEQALTLKDLQEIITDLKDDCIIRSGKIEYNSYDDEYWMASSTPIHRATHNSYENTLYFETHYTINGTLGVK